MATNATRNGGFHAQVPRPEFAPVRRDFDGWFTLSPMLALLIADRDAADEARALGSRLEEHGLEVREEPATAGEEAQSPPIRLAEALVRLEGLISAGPPAVVALAGESDEVLAAALVAAKLEIPIELERREGAQGGNRRLLGLLAGASQLPTLGRR
jgi:hypothetical protein